MDLWILRGQGIVGISVCEAGEEKTGTESKDQEDSYFLFYANAHDDTELLTDLEGRIWNQYTCDVFGRIETKQEEVENRYIYYGQQYDPLTQQYYLRARYYQPQIGLFTQEDAYRGNGLKLYAHCANYLMKYGEPSGYARRSQGSYSSPEEETKTQNREHKDWRRC